MLPAALPWCRDRLDPGAKDLGRHWKSLAEPSAPTVFPQSAPFRGPNHLHRIHDSQVLMLSKPLLVDVPPASLTSLRSRNIPPQQTSLEPPLPIEPPLPLEPPLSACLRDPMRHEPEALRIFDTDLTTISEVSNSQRRRPMGLDRCAERPAGRRAEVPHGVSPRSVISRGYRASNSLHNFRWPYSC